MKDVIERRLKTGIGSIYIIMKAQKCARFHIFINQFEINKVSYANSNPILIIQRATFDFAFFILFETSHYIIFLKN